MERVELTYRHAGEDVTIRADQPDGTDALPALKLLMPEGAEYLHSRRFPVPDAEQGEAA